MDAHLESVQQLSRAVMDAHEGVLLVLTGAGISLASGIPTFRGTDPEAVWKRNLTELGTYRYFRKDPAGSWSWYLERFDRALAAKPNPAHYALAALERWRLMQGAEYLLVTQNVDTLHESAGSQRLVKVHGSLDRVRCVRPGCRFGAPRGSIARSDVDLAPLTENPIDANVPRCPECRSRLRQHVLWFDEDYGSHEDYQIDRVERAAQNARVVLFVGTSFSVGITDFVLRRALADRVPVYSIDPSGRAVDPRVSVIAATAETILPALCSELGAPLVATPASSTPIA